MTMIDRKNVEIFDQEHLMNIEGCQEKIVSIEMIKEFEKTIPFSIDSIEIWYDSLQEVWRWMGDIK